MIAKWVVTVIIGHDDDKSDVINPPILLSH